LIVETLINLIYGVERHGLGSLLMRMGINMETDEKEVQDTSWRGSGGVPSASKKPPKLGD
jgi:hypothetical protein